jgi:hypothetical protein
VSEQNQEIREGQHCPESPPPPPAETTDDWMLAGLLDGLLPDGRGWSLGDGQGGTLAHVAARNGLLPPDFDGWEIADCRRMSVAHEAAEHGHLPTSFRAWELRDPVGRTVAHLAAERGPLPPGFDLWTLQDKCGINVAEVAAAYRHLPPGVEDWRELIPSAGNPFNLRPPCLLPGCLPAADPELARRLEERLASRFPTLWALSREPQEGYGFTNLLGDFLDAFYIRERETKTAMLRESPADMPERWQVPFLAGTAELLSRRFDLVPPPWIAEHRCFLPEDETYIPACLAGLPESRRLAMKRRTPLEFSSRNLIADWDVLYRV